VAATADRAIQLAAKQLLWIPGSALTGSPGMTGLRCASRNDVRLLQRSKQHLQMCLAPT